MFMQRKHRLIFSLIPKTNMAIYGIALHMSGFILIMLSWFIILTPLIGK